MVKIKIIAINNNNSKIISFDFRFCIFEGFLFLIEGLCHLLNLEVGCNLCREIMWPDPQALDLGAILIIAAVKKVGGPGPVPSHQLKA
jgi:hypothetical protein